MWSKDFFRYKAVFGGVHWGGESRSRGWARLTAHAKQKSFGWGGGMSVAKSKHGNKDEAMEGWRHPARIYLSLLQA